jgi:hypothetical protein
MYTQMAIKQTIAAPITIARPRLFPRTLRSGLVVVVFASAINSTPEKKQPGTQCNQNPETKIDKRQRAKMGFDLRPDEDPSQYQHAEHSDGDAQHPRREE